VICWSFVGCVVDRIQTAKHRKIQRRKALSAGGFVAESGNDDVSGQIAAAFPCFGGQVADGPHFVGELITLVVS